MTNDEGMTKHQRMMADGWRLGFGDSLELGAWDLELPNRVIASKTARKSKLKRGRAASRPWSHPNHNLNFFNICSATYLWPVSVQ
jgi:hypothetical protein